MNRYRKRKEPTLMEELREMELLDEGETVDIPDLEIDDLIEENSLSVVVRCLNPYVHKVGGLVKALPPIWGLEERTRGRGVGNDRVQFIFSSEDDLQHVLTKGPWFVNGWMVSLDQWSPDPPPEFLKRIPFWIRVRGLPIHMLKKQVVDVLLDPLGKVEKVELHAKNSNSLEYIRALVHISTEEPLQFRRNARFKSGATIPTELEYEKLLKVCYTCKRLTHDQSRCPNRIDMGPVEDRGSQKRAKEQSLRSKLSEKEATAKVALHKSTTKGVVIQEPSGGAGPRGGHQKPKESYREEKKKGKRVASTPQIQWRPKSDRGGSRKSRSTEESTANPKSSNDQGGIKNNSTEEAGLADPEDTVVMASVFHRLGSNEKVRKIAGGRTGKETNILEGNLNAGDLRIRLSGGSTEDKRDGQSSKGSRSPPSIEEVRVPKLSRDVVKAPVTSERRRNPV
ncbi:Uncharacterized protein Rs2_00806 [Raphanus sativus]|nr:Uncharacterized protein Rs2_00806 [Raphanus sativus]